jgi:hypothetical protein
MWLCMSASFHYEGRLGPGTLFHYEWRLGSGMLFHFEGMLGPGTSFHFERRLGPSTLFNHSEITYRVPISPHSEMRRSCMNTDMVIGICLVIFELVSE